MPLLKTGKTEHVSVSIESDLLARAREAGTDLSAVLERALKFELLVAHGEHAVDELQAIAEYNRFTGEHGLLADEWRKF